MVMDIVLVVLGAVIIILLVVLIFKKPAQPELSADFKTMEERLIRVEGEVGKINPAIDRNFRENRKEINENLDAEIQSFKQSERLRYEEGLEKLIHKNKENVQQIAQDYKENYLEKQKEISEHIVKEVLKRYGN